MKLSDVDISELNIDDIVKWPITMQLLLVIIFVVLLQLFSGWFYLMPKYQKQQQLAQQEQKLKTEIIEKAQHASVLPKLTMQLKQSKATYQSILKQLPAEQELSNLLSVVNELGVQHHLTFERIDWGEKVSEQFLYRLPLNIELTGTYNDIGDFSQAIAKLPRIVSLHDVTLQRLNPQTSTVRAKITAYTYQLKLED